MSKKTKITQEDEEKIIDFVKLNEVLYNVKHKDFRNTEKRNQLWLKLANEINIDGLYLYNFWSIVLEYYQFIYHFVIPFITI